MWWGSHLNRYSRSNTDTDIDTDSDADGYPSTTS